MPTISDAYQQLVDANTNLQTLHNDEVATTGAVNNVRASVDQAVQLLSALVQGQIYTNEALFHIAQQNDTIICALEHISKNTCMILNEEHTQTGLQTAMAKDASQALDIDKTVHPEAALDLCRREILRKQTEECCPPEPPLQPCAYQPCPGVKPLSPPRSPGLPGVSK